MLLIIELSLCSTLPFFEKRLLESSAGVRLLSASVVAVSIPLFMEFVFYDGELSGRVLPLAFGAFVSLILTSPSIAESIC